jgi:hypothetical protein
MEEAWVQLSSQWQRKRSAMIPRACHTRRHCTHRPLRGRLRDCYA